MVIISDTGQGITFENQVQPIQNLIQANSSPIINSSGNTLGLTIS